FPRLARGDGEEGVPVVGGRDVDRVDVLPVEEVPEVAIALAARAVHGASALAVRRVDVANGRVDGEPGAPQRVHVAGALAAAAYRAHDDLLVRAQDALGEHGGGREGCSRCARLDKEPPPGGLRRHLVSSPWIRRSTGGRNLSRAKGPMMPGPRGLRKR